MATDPGGPWRVRVSGELAALRKFLARHPMEVQAVRPEGSRVRVDLTVNERQRADLKALDLRIESHVDVPANLVERRKEVEPADRFAAGRLPEGIGRLLD